MLLFDLLIFLYPRELREVFAEEMRGVFAESIEDGAAGTLIQELVGLALGGVAARSKNIPSYAAGFFLAAASHAAVYKALLHWSYFLMLTCITLHAQTPEQTIRNIYRDSLTAMRTVKTEAELERLIDSMDVPEWTATMPAGEPLTRNSVLSEGKSVLAIAPDRRPIPQMDIAYVTETGWNVLVVYWRYRQDGARTIGSLYRDTWVQTARGWRRIHMEKFFPDRLLTDGDRAIFAPRR